MGSRIGKRERCLQQSKTETQAAKLNAPAVLSSMLLSFHKSEALLLLKQSAATMRAAFTRWVKGVQQSKTETQAAKLNARAVLSSMLLSFHKREASLRCTHSAVPLLSDFTMSVQAFVAFTTETQLSMLSELSVSDDVIMYNSILLHIVLTM